MLWFLIYRWTSVLKMLSHSCRASLATRAQTETPPLKVRNMFRPERRGEQERWTVVTEETKTRVYPAPAVI